MKKLLYLLATLFFLASCVGQKDDPIPEPDPDPDPIDKPEDPVDPPVEEGGDFFRRVLALEFTGTWCQYCPRMAYALDEAMEARPDRFVDIAIHAYDDLEAKECAGIVSLFGVSAFPTMVFDWNKSTAFSDQKASLMTAYADKAIAGGAPCGMALSSKMDAGLLSVTVRIKATEPGTYKLFAALVEDGIVVNQTGAGANFSCRGVLLGYFGNDYSKGRSAELMDGDEYETSYTADIPEHPAKCRIVAYVMRDAVVVNAAAAPLYTTTDFAYEKVVP